MTTEEILYIIVIVLFVVYLLLSALTMNRFGGETKKKIDAYEKQELKNPFSEIEINKVLDKYESQREQAIEDYMNGFISGIDPYDDGEDSRGTL